MGRGVSYLSNAEAITYIPTSEFVGVDAEEDIDSFYWDEAVRDVAVRLSELWPSFNEAEGWDGRETRVVAKNDHAIVGVSEYCGMTSISMAVNPRSEYPELAESWIRRIATKFDKVFGSLVRVGTMSNGESVYQRRVA